MPASPDPDVVIIGSGVGGLFAAARLVLSGRRALVIESESRLGGRFSTIDIDGYRVPTGAIAIPAAGPFQETLRELGVNADLRIPNPPIRVRVRGRELTMGGAAWDFMMKTVTKGAGRVADGLRRGELADHEQDLTIDEWVRTHTRNKTVGTLIQSLVATTFTCNSDELPARTFFENLRETGAFKTYGFAPHGNVVIADAMAAAIEARGGTVLTGHRVTAIEVQDGAAVAVHTAAADGSRRFAADVIISNAGPRGTAGLLSDSPFAADFAARVRDVRPTAMLTLSFSTTTEALPKCPGMMEYADTERLCTLGNLTALCPDLAPAGHTLYEAMSVPRPGIGASFDTDHEWALLEADLRREMPEFAAARIVHRKVMSGDAAPAMHSLPGEDLELRTPIANLVEAGDGVKPAGWTGTGACALSGLRAADAVEELLAGAVPAVSGTRLPPERIPERTR
jgi:phytoene desaturase